MLSVKTLELPAGIAGLQSDNPRRALAMMAARFYGRQPRHIAAVTGTNGKTSIAHFTRLLWGLRGHKAASLGTLGLVAPDRTRYGTLTTADPVALHRDLSELAQEGVDHVAMEASSHGLDQFRLDGVQVRAAAFTNLTRDHLDYHATMEAYGRAKQRLFSDVMETGGTAVLNADVPEFARLVEICRQRKHRILSYGRHGADIQIVSQTPLPDGQRLSLSVLGRSYDIVMPLVAEFQAMNAAAAIGLVLAGDSDVDAVVNALTRLTPVPGRIELAATRRNGAGVYVDYAHTPDALETVLTALRPHAQRKLVAVFGCGGDRDPGKRPMMGAIGAKLADIAIVTDDNPRTEDAAKIRSQVMAAAPRRARSARGAMPFSLRSPDSKPAMSSSWPAKATSRARSSARPSTPSTMPWLPARQSPRPTRPEATHDAPSLDLSRRRRRHGRPFDRRLDRARRVDRQPHARARRFVRRHQGPAA